MSFKSPKTISIITIGDELLIGQTIDTNSAWMAQVLNKVGFSINRRVAIGDDWDNIWNALNEEEKKNDIVKVLLNNIIKYVKTKIYPKAYLAYNRLSFVHQDL